ncbi:MAG: SLBB domain-containing protein [Candidatus Poribacteria bacterium]|nr:SLBB domain-containing protein [Candidatus Poribacteria bacterium]
MSNDFRAVSDPGSYPVGNPNRLSELLLLAGHPQPAADFSRVRIFDLTQEKLTSRIINLERFLLEADLSANPYLSSGTLIYIPQIRPREELFGVNVTGQVIHPGSYEATSKT